MPRVDENYTRDYVLNPTGVVYCQNNSEIMLQQIKQRERDNNATFLQANLSDQQLKDKIEIIAKIAEDKVASLRERNVPILEINTSDDKVANSQLINNFVRELTI